MVGHDTFTAPFHTPLWTRLQSYFDQRPQLCEQLMRHLGWSRHFARAAIGEYQRFCWLAAQSAQALSPSEIVDQVWHQHLQHTRDYWGRFCPQVLGRPLHHDPAEPGREARWRVREQYAQTLWRYQQSFGAPPEAFWPAAGQGPRYRLVDTRSARVSRRWRRGASLAATLLGVAAPAAAMGALGPLDWSGPAFLALFLPLCAGAVVASLLLRRALRTAPDAGWVGRLTPGELACLAGGEARFMDAAVAELLARDVVRWDAAAGLKLTGHAVQLAPELSAVVDLIRRRPRPDKLRRHLRAATQPVIESLRRRGLMVGADAAWRLCRLSAAIPAAVCALGLAKIAIGLARDRPVGILVAACIALAAFAAAMLFNLPRNTRQGDEALLRARRGHAAALRTARTQDLGLAVALLGTAALAGTAHAAYHEARRGDGSSSDSSGSDSSSCDGGSDSGGGSGCGGCGGGGGD